MTEAAWLASTDPRAMLEFLSGKTTDRKLRLFAVACCRRVEHLLPEDSGGRAAIAYAENDADGPSSGPAACTELVVGVATCSAAFAAAAQAAQSTEDAAGFVADAAHLLGTDYPEEESEVWSVAAERFDADELGCQAALLRHIVGNPFRPQSPLSHVPANVRDLAEAVYQQNRASIGPLCDALLEVGLGELAGHFAHEREGHPKGCWVLDVLTGRA
jgi:hypothetical protein